MRKIAFLAVTALVLIAATVAYAAHVNEYTVNGSTSADHEGSNVEKPTPIGVKFGFTVGEASNNRPAVVEKYTITLRRHSRQHRASRRSTAKTTLDAKGPSGCPSKSLVGTGFIANNTGTTNNEADKSIQCNAALSVLNLGWQQGLDLRPGRPEPADPRRKCPIELAAAIPATFRNTTTGAGAVARRPGEPQAPGLATHHQRREERHLEDQEDHQERQRASTRHRGRLHVERQAHRDGHVPHRGRRHRRREQAGQLQEVADKQV